MTMDSDFVVHGVSNIPKGTWLWWITNAMAYQEKNRYEVIVKI